MIPAYVCLDLETDTTTCYGRKANPWYNEIVAVGYKFKDEYILSDYVYKEQRGILDLKESLLLVGHNLTFDLLYLWNLRELQEFFKSGGRVWDTQLVEYLLTGHETKFASLRDLAVTKYKCKERQKVMEKYWDEKTVKVLDWSKKDIIKTFPLGTDNRTICQYLDTLVPSPSCDIIHGHIPTSKIPKELVLHDVENDVLDTEQIFLKQYAEAERLGMLKLIEHRMDGLLACIECEYNGMKINREILERNKSELEIRLGLKQKELLQMISEVWKS